MEPDYGCDLQATTRISVPGSEVDLLKRLYTTAWQVPGMPQLLMLSDFTGEVFKKHKIEHPEGYTRPWDISGDNKV